LHDHDGIIIFDAGPGSTLNEYLRDSGIDEIDALLISHSDADHLAGAINLLSSTEFRVKAVYLNPDSQNSGATYQMFRVAIRDAREHRDTKVHTQLNTTLSGTLHAGVTTVEVLSPAPETALGGPGSHDLDGKRITPNSMSAVIRLIVNEQPIVLLPGDIDAVGLAALLERHPSLLAKVLVFPHHGGRPGGRASAADFSRELCEQVRPDLVIFSIGRGKHNTPHPDIVGAILAHCSNVHIACTQLSESCASERPSADASHLLPEVASGKRNRSCCIGTIVVWLDAPPQTFPILAAHREFVERVAPTALCLRKVNTVNSGLDRLA
jgi:competence protein ComEC